METSRNSKESTSKVLRTLFESIWIDTITTKHHGPVPPCPEKPIMTLEEIFKHKKEAIIIYMAKKGQPNGRYSNGKRNALGRFFISLRSHGDNCLLILRNADPVSDYTWKMAYRYFTGCGISLKEFMYAKHFHEIKMLRRKIYVYERKIEEPLKGRLYPLPLKKYMEFSAKRRKSGDQKKSRFPISCFRIQENFNFNQALG